MALNTKRIANIIIFNVGGSNENEWVTLQQPDKSSTGSSNIGSSLTTKISKADTVADRLFNVQLKKLDDIVETHIEDDISLIKIDIEGFELKALHGLRETIIKNSPIIGFEQHAIEFAVTNGLLSTPTINYLKEQGYCYFYEPLTYYDGKIWRIDGTGRHSKYMLRGSKKVSRMLLLIETCLFGFPTKCYRMRCVERFQKKPYHMLFASKEPLDRVSFEGAGHLSN